MFTILEGINRFLGFLNIKSKLKNRIYIVIGTLTTGYIGYLAYNFFRFHAYKRGIVYLLIFLILVYCLILNIYYYFTEKSVKWDITPYFSKLVEEEEQEKVLNKERVKEHPKAKNIDGQLVIYDDVKAEFSEGQLLHTSVTLLEKQELKLEEIINFLVLHQLTKKDYGGISDGQLKEKTYAFSEGIKIPSFSLEEKDRQLILSIGLNATERFEMALVTEIGEMPIEKIIETYEVIPISVTIVGGEYKMPSRASFLTGTDPYAIQVQVALVLKNK